MVRFDDGTFVTTMHVRPGLVEADSVVEKEEFEAVVAIPTRRIRTKRALDPLEVVVEELETSYDPNHPAEIYAEALVEEENITVDQIETLVTLLPHDLKTPARPESKERIGKIWSAGAVDKDDKIGVRRSTRSFPIERPRRWLSS